MSMTLVPLRRALGCTAAIGALAFALPVFAQEAPIVQPGAPGQAARTLSADEASRIANNRYSTDDVRFM